MTKSLLFFDVPQLYNPFDRDEILCNLESLAINACYISNGNNNIIAEDAEINFDKHDPVCDYEKSYDELIEILGGYNYSVIENGLSFPQLKLVIDDAKSRSLVNATEFPIYKIVLCNDSF